MWNFIVYVLGFIDCEVIFVCCMFIIFMMFVVKMEVFKFNLLKGLFYCWFMGLIFDYIQYCGGKLYLCYWVKWVDYSEGEFFEIIGLQLGMFEGEICVEVDVYLVVCDVFGIQKLLFEVWNCYFQFKVIYQLEVVFVVIVQFCYDGWVIELGDVQEDQC